jgi:hypothetical protein
MASVVIAGNTSGTVTLSAPDIAGSTTLTLPTTSGTIVTTAGGSTVPFALGSAASPSITFTGDTNTGIFSPGADTIAFSEGGVESMRIDSVGNVGIGVTSVSSNISGSARVLGICDPTNSNLASLRLGSGNSFASGNKMEAFSAAGSCGLFGQDNFPMVFSTNSSERMRITSTGNVGIGTSSPQRILTVGAGTGASVMSIFASTSLSSAIHFTDTNTATDFQGFVTYGHDVDALRFGTAETERMRITSGGNLAVGATSISNAAARAAIVNAGGGSIVMQIQRSGENPSYIGSDNSDIFSVWDSTPTKRFAVTSAGSCQNTTGSYGTISDAKLKENIVDATPKLDKVMQLQVKNFNFKTEPNLKQIGFIAQELQQVFPSLIEETPDQDENGEATGEVTLGVKTTVLVPILVKAIQEQQAIINEQASTIAAFEARLVALENK